MHLADAGKRTKKHHLAHVSDACEATPSIDEVTPSLDENSCNKVYDDS